jgi:asparagine synthase (glutamine-hydrolysing)
LLTMLSALPTKYQRMRAHIAVSQPSTRALIREIHDRKLTYVDPGKLRRCAMALELVRRADVPGCFLEAGVALGGTAILIGKLRPRGRVLKLYDVFGMIPPPGPEDEQDAHRRYEVISSGRSNGIGGELYYGYRSDLMSQVVDNLKSFGLDPEKEPIELVPGKFEDALHLSEPVAFAHIDCDWYQSVTTCIDRIFPRLSLGGVMVFDDYSSYSGCRKAVDRFIDKRGDIDVLFAAPSIGIRKLR